MVQKAPIAVCVYTTSINTKPFKSLKREKLLNAFSNNYKIKWKSYKSLADQQQ